MSQYQLKNVLSTDGLDKNGIKLLKEFGFNVVEQKYSKVDLIKELVNYDAVIIRSATTIDDEIIRAVTANDNCRLKVIARAGTGVDNINVETATEKGLLVINTPSANTLSAAEHTFALMCCLSRQIPQAYLSMQQGKWDRKTFMGTELMHKTLAIIGLGKIGKEVALRAQVFGMRTIGFDPLVSLEEAKKFNVEWMELDQLWPLADYITLHVPLIAQTLNLISLQTFDKCKKGVQVINCSRGGIINESDLLTALESGKCGGAALDVFSEEPPKCTNLIKHPRLISTPHLGASTVEAQFRVSMEIAENLIFLHKGDSLSGLVNGGSIELSLKSEMHGWKLLLEKLSRVVVNKTDIKLLYLSGVALCSNREFERFVSNYLAMSIYSLKKESVNLINSNIYAKANKLVISIEKKCRKESSKHPQLILNIDNQLLEFTLINNRLFLLAFNDINLEQPVLLDGPGRLLVTSKCEVNSKILQSLDGNFKLVSYVSQQNQPLFVFVVKEKQEKKFDNLNLSIEI